MVPDLILSGSIVPHFQRFFVMSAGIIPSPRLRTRSSAPRSPTIDIPPLALIVPSAYLLLTLPPAAPFVLPAPGFKAGLLTVGFKAPLVGLYAGTLLGLNVGAPKGPANHCSAVLNGATGTFSVGTFTELAPVDGFRVVEPPYPPPLIAAAAAAAARLASASFSSTYLLNASRSLR